jgi:hypothetical protein
MDLKRSETTGYPKADSYGTRSNLLPSSFGDEQFFCLEGLRLASNIEFIT